ARVRDIDIALCVDGNRVCRAEETRLGSSRAPRLDEDALAVELRDARVAHAVGDEDVACCVPGDVHWTVEHVALSARAGKATASTSTARARNWVRNVHGLRLSAKQHED